MAEMGARVDGLWCWRWSWRRELFIWEENLLQDLWRVEEPYMVKMYGVDYWFWGLEDSGIYFVITTYKAILKSSDRH